MQLDVLPTRFGGAPENMATDFFLLKRYGEAAHARFRHYGWHRPAFTFGFSQKVEFVRAQLPREERVELCRRATGGGIVDHRNDWTYALVIPRGHAFCDAPAPHSYRAVHEALADSFVGLGLNVQVKTACERQSDEAGCSAKQPTVCFENAELYDVVLASTGEKIAGAAQKRAREGLLFQGSVSRMPFGRDFPWQALHTSFVRHLGRILELDTRETGWPDFDGEELTGLIEQYSAPEWNELR